MSTVAKTSVVVLLYLTCATCLLAEETEQRTKKYTSRSPEEATAWQHELRGDLAKLMKMDDLIGAEKKIPLEFKIISTEKRDKYTYNVVEFNSTPGRRIQAVLTVPTGVKGPFPAVLSIPGHGGKKESPYQPGGYNQFTHLLAEKGYVTICTSVSRHEVYEKGRTLMGERLWDLMRCVDLLESRDDVDDKRIGCAGLSLGGEMAMWLGAMDERIRASVSSGFLTRMDQMEQDHCMCWKFPGLRQLVDFADIYSMTAPRALLCQNGMKEKPTWFPVSIAKEEMKDIKHIYKDFGKPDNAAFVAHPEGHVIDVPSLIPFIEKHVKRAK